MVEFAELSIQKSVPIAKKRYLKYILQCFTIPLVFQQRLKFQKHVLQEELFLKLLAKATEIRG